MKCKVILITLFNFLIKKIKKNKKTLALNKKVLYN